MWPSRRSRLVGLLALVLLAALSGAATAAGPREAVALEQLPDTEITVGFRDVPVEKVFEVVARLAHVPFVLDFEPDPALKVTLNAQNVSARAFFQSLADTYGLEYEASGAGIVVRRPGMPSAARPLTVGAWPQKPRAAVPQTADEASLNAVTLKLRLPTGKTAMLILQGGSMSVGMEEENIRIALQGKASMKGETADVTGFMEMVDPVLVVEPQPAPDGLLKLVDMYASEGHHIEK